MPKSCGHDMGLRDAWRAVICHFHFSWWETSSASQLCPWKSQTKKEHSDVDNRKKKSECLPQSVFLFTQHQHTFLSIFIWKVYLLTYYNYYITKNRCICYLHQQYQLLYPESSPESLGEIHSSSRLYLVQFYYSITQEPNCINNHYQHTPFRRMGEKERERQEILLILVKNILYKSGKPSKPQNVSGTNNKDLVLTLSTCKYLQKNLSK